MTEWYVGTEGNDPVGPVDERLIERGIIAGRIPPDALVCQVGAGAWRSLAEVQCFAEALRTRLPSPEARPTESAPTAARVSGSPTVDARPLAERLPPRRKVSARTMIMVVAGATLAALVIVPVALHVVRKLEQHREAQQRASACENAKAAAAAALDHQSLTDARRAIDSARQSCLLDDAFVINSLQIKADAEELKLKRAREAELQAAQQAAADQAAKERMPSALQQIADAISRARKQSTSGRPDQAAESLDGASQVLASFNETSVANSEELVQARMRVDAERKRIAPALEAYRQAHLSEDELADQCSKQASELRALVARADLARSHGDLETLQSIIPQVQQLTPKWSATTNRLAAIDPIRASVACDLK